ncbi:MAG TPA: GDP-mannose 4,6-dehydratase [Microbacterium sp.]|nr:GDP-mannose 4,6-dehydratase [Microbacterium sp.]
MRVLITGGAGFIGTNLALHLAEQPSIDEVVIFDDLSTGVHRKELDCATMVLGDLRDADAIDSATARVDRVIHLGALGSVPRSVADPGTTNDVNIRGTLNVLEAARRNDVGHVIVASSSSVYGANRTIPKVESMATLPISPYAVSKLATESYANAFEASYGLPTLAFRFFNVFGPFQRADHVYAAVIPKFLDALKSGAPVVIHGDGTQSRDFTSVHSVVDALTQASIGGVTHDTPVNLAFGSRYTLLEVLDHLEQIHGYAVPRIHTENRAGDVPHSQASSELFQSLLPSISRPSLEEALAEAYRWYMPL